MPIPRLLARLTALAAFAILAVPTGAFGIEEIVVTTRYKEENLQTVPIAITAIGEDRLQKSGVNSLEDLTRLTPSVSINEAMSQNDQRITIRGLTNSRGRSNVAFLVDGVDVTSETTGTNAGSPMLVNQRLLNDIQRVEIVRGPQSALFGRAAFAGAISYVTADPGDVFEGRVATDLAQYGGRELAGVVSGPLSENVGLRLNGVYWNEDGAFTNAVSGASVGGGDGRALAATLLMRPADEFKLRARVTWSDDHYDIRPVAIIRNRIAVPLPLDVLDSDPDTEGAQDPVFATLPATPLLVPRVGSAAGLSVYSSEDPLTGGEYPGNDLEVLRGTLFAEWRLPKFTLTSNTGVTDADFTQRYDLDRQAEGRPDVILGHNDVDTIDTTEQFSQEIRLASGWDGPLQATLGGLYWKEKRESLNRNLIVVCSTVTGSSVAGPGCLDSGYQSWQEMYADITELEPDNRVPTRAETDHWSVYAQLEWQINETLSAAIEDRYTDEDFFAELFIGSGNGGDGSSVSTCSNFFRDAGPNMTMPVNTDPESANFNLGCYVGPSQSGTVNTSYHTPKVTLEWQATNDLLVYASASKGQKPGGISLLAITAPLPQPFSSFLFKPEKMWAYEIGAKQSWDGSFGSLQLNGAVFYQDYTDKQATKSIIDPVSGFPLAIVTNASAAHVAGAEIETTWSPIPDLSLSLAYTWLETAYDDYHNATRSAGEIAIQGSCPRPNYDADGDGDVDASDRRYCDINYSGNELEFAPEHAFAAQMSYRHPIGDGIEAFADLDARYQGEVFTSVNNFNRIDDYWKLEARLGMEGDRWRVLAYVRNLLDDDTVSSVGGSPDFATGAVGIGLPTNPQFTTTVTLPEPRTFGMRLALDF